MGTILTHAEPLVSGTRTEDEIRQHERQLCALEVLLAAEKLGWDASPAAISRYVNDRTVDPRLVA